MNGPVLYEVVNAVAWVTINRPEARNALNAAVREGLWENFRRFDADDEARVLVLTGAGEDVFCAGGDLKEMSDTQLKVPPPDFVPQLGRNIVVDKPVISAVNGAAYGGGFLLALNTDLCIAAEHAKFGITEARWGRGAPWAALLPWVVGPRFALEMLLTAEPIDVQRAREAGFVNRVVPAADLRDQAQAMAEKIAANAPLSVRAGKQMVYGSIGRLPDEAFAQGEACFEPAYLSEDAQEGPLAFREKRPPQWKGR